MRRRPFGQIPTGEPVTAYSLLGSGGLVLECLDYGGIVARLLVPDREGRLADVVLGFDTLAPYLAGHPYFGVITGRVAGRIRGAAFVLDGHRHTLAANDGANHLHGGLHGFDKHLWRAESVARADSAPSLRLSRVSPDEEESYPGNLSVAVTYTVTTDNTFLIETEASTDRAPPVCLTHHGYFNLGGEASGSIADHTLQIQADSYAPADDTMALLGRSVPVSPANDFNVPRLLSEAIPGLHRQHGDLYFLRPSGSPAAVLSHAASGRILSVTTNEPCLQLYTGAALDGTLLGKSGALYSGHAGLCPECQGCSDAVNVPEFGDIILRPGPPLRRTTSYRFTTA